MGALKRILSNLLFTPTSDSDINDIEGVLNYSQKSRSLVTRSDIPGLFERVARELNIRVINNSGVSISRGQVVYLEGSFNQLPSVALAKSDLLRTSRIVGVASTDINNGSVGMVKREGVLENIDTSSFNVGDKLFISSTVAGELTTDPQPIEVEVGLVVRSHSTQGEIAVGFGGIIRRDNVVLIRNQEDLPDPSGGVIPLLDGKVYLFASDVTIDTPLDFGNETVVRGRNRFEDTLTYTGTDVAMKGVDVSAGVQNLTINAPSGSLFDFKDSTGNEKIHSIFIRDVDIDNTDKIGRFENLKTIRITQLDVTNTVIDGLEFFGSSNGDLLIFDSLVRDFTGTLIKLGTSVWDIVHIDRSEILVKTGRVGISGQTNNGNLASPDGIGRLTDNNWLGVGDYILDINNGGTRWNFISNGGVDDVSDNIATGYYSMEDNATVTLIATQNVWYKILGTTVPGGNNLRFDSPVSNRLRYLGETEYKGNIVVTGSVEIAAGATNYEVTVFKNGSKLPNVKIPFAVTNGKPNGFAITVPVRANTDDYFEVYIRDIGGNKDVTVNDLHLSIG